jgi:hydroxyacylglutathione hydrolase
MVIKSLTVTPFEQNSRIVFDDQSGSAIIVDPGGECDRIVNELTDLRATIDSVFLTHSHIDHCGGVRQLYREFERLGWGKPPLLAHKAEQGMRGTIAQQAMMFGLSSSQYENVPEPDRYLDQGDTVELGSNRGLVLFTPGHSPGHVCLFFDSVDATIVDCGAEVSVAATPVLLGGDAVFCGSIGRTDLPGGDYRQLLASIRDQILTLPDKTIILSGHGPLTTVGAERGSNPFFRDIGLA